MASEPESQEKFEEGFAATTATPNDSAAQKATGRPGRSSKVFLLLVLSAVAVVVGVLVRFVGFGGGTATSAGAGEWGADWLWVDKDPFEGEVYLWNHARVGSSSGLSLRIVNALEERWHPYFDVAVMEWNGGEPDVVNLRPSTTGYDDRCSSASGVMKVCNNDYGETGWKGQNSVLLNHNGYIVSSVALMNDYYLQESSSEDREYTMCHEIGHGLGLPHTDEKFWNLDRGNCMDYTSRPGNNLKPGQVSFDELARSYSPATSLQGGSGGDDGVVQAMRTFEVFTREAQQNTKAGFFDIGSGFFVVIYRLIA